MPEVPNIRSVPQLPEFRWNAAAGQYIAPNGQFVPRRAIRSQLDKFITGVTDEMAAISNSLAAGDLSLADWQTRMMQLSKETNLAGAALERGGWYQMDSSDFGRVGAKVRAQYDYIDRFAAQIESGEVPLNGSIARRARLYGEQGRVTYYSSTRVRAAGDGFDQERSVLTPADHCAECVDQDAKGFQPIGSMVSIGDRICRSNCKCYVVYRNSATGETRIA